MAKQVIMSNLSKLSKRHQRIARAMPAAVEKGYEQIADESIVLYQRTTRTWKRKPRFIPLRTPRGVTIATDSAIYKYVDFGTRAHDIVARRVPFLVFRWPYKAATKPRVISSYKAQYGDNWAKRKRVRHPGIKARDFTDTIAKRMSKRANSILRKQLEQATFGEGTGL